MARVKVPKPVTIDFETHKIMPRPLYPPMPVGVSIKYPGKKAKYYAFGHLEGNNCTWSEAEKALRDAYDHSDGILFQNGKFDLDVAETHFGIKIPEWNKIHDTMFLIYLHNPHAKELGLKPAAEELLGMPPEEQEEVGEWLLSEQPIPGVRINRGKQGDNYFGAYYSWAPGDIVGRYADGDTIRTEKLFTLLYKEILDRGMGEAYDRERKLALLLLEMERQGLAVNLKQLRRDVDMYTDWMGKIESWVIKTLKAPADLNLNSGQQLVEAMIDAGKVDESLMPRTATGKIATNKDALLAGVTDKKLLGVLNYRERLKTCLNTFMKPWLETAELSGGLIYTIWNQTRTPDSVGTRTGRLSSTPNFQNIPKEFAPIFDHEKPGAKLPKSPFKDIPPLPKVRCYVVPFEGDVLIDRDFSQQEIRILAHFDGGSMMHDYQADPWLDFHDVARGKLAEQGLFYERKPVKNTNFGLIYGMGVGKLAEKNGTTVDEAKDLKAAILKLYPGLKEMYSDMRLRMQQDLPIRTWGGREYYCEPAKLVNGRLMTFDYKMVNVLVQGSAADCTKESIIRYHAAKHKDAKIILNVHDQITVSVPPKLMKSEMEVLRKAMESVEFDVQILSEGSVSDTNWGDLKDYDKKGKIIK